MDEIGSTDASRHLALYFGSDDEIADVYRKACPSGWELAFHDELDEQELARALASAEAIIHRNRPITAYHLGRAPKLRIVQRHGVGLDSLDVNLLLSNHVSLCVNPEGTEAVAEHTMLLILASMRPLCEMSADVKDGNWRRDRFSGRSRSLVGATVGIAGYGRIGKAVARRLAPFGCRINILTRSMRVGPSDPTSGPLVTNLGSMTELFSRSDIVTLHLPLTSSTSGIVDRNLLDVMPKGAVLVNTARGGLLQTHAVLEALESGKLWALAVDVMSNTDALRDDRLIKHPNVVATPHSAAATRDTFTRKVRFTFANLQRAAAGQPLLERVV